MLSTDWCYVREVDFWESLFDRRFSVSFIFEVLGFGFEWWVGGGGGIGKARGGMGRKRMKEF